MRRVLLLVAIAAAATAAAASTSTAPLLGLVGGRDSRQLARIDASTLRPNGVARVDVGSGGCASRNGGEACWGVPPWAKSPDGALLAIARNDRFTVRSIRVIEAATLRVRADIRLPGDPVGALAWFPGNRILAVQEACCSGQQLVAIDLANRAVTARRKLSGSVLQVAATSRELVLVLARTGSIGRATLAVADPRGLLRTVRLERISAGVKPRPGSDHEFDSRSPGLAVDPLGRRAYVVGEHLIADVDLTRLTPSYHPVVQQGSARSLLASLRPTTATKGGSASTRVARWLGDGMLAISGGGEETADGRAHVEPFGLRLVDTRTWKTRTIDADATGFVAAGGLLLATGWSSDSTPLGVAAYGRDGTERFRLFAGEQVWIEQVHDGRVYVGVARAGAGQSPLRIVSLESGTVLGTRGQPLPWLLQGAAGNWWSTS